MNGLLLAGVLVTAYLQDVGFSTKIALVAHGRTRLAMIADAFGMLTNTAYMVLTGLSAVTTGLSAQTLAAFLAIMVCGALGTGTGMLLSAWLEVRFGVRVDHPLRPRIETHLRE